MKKLYSLLFLFACLVVSFSSAGQSLGIASSGLINFPDTAYANSSTNFDLYVKNTGTQPFSGAFNLNYSVNSVTQSSSIYSGSLMGLAPGDSALVPVTSFYFSTPEFTPGTINIVVVWPISSFPTSDSVTVGVFIQDSVNNPSVITGMASHISPEVDAVFPNPAADHLTLKNIAVSQVASITAIDAMGRTIPVHYQQSNNIAHLEAGYYTLFVQLKDGQRKYFRFLKI